MLHQGNDLTSKAVTKDDKVNILEWSTPSPDLNPLENLWTELKKLSPQTVLSHSFVSRNRQEFWQNIVRNLHKGYIKVMGVYSSL